MRVYLDHSATTYVDPKVLEKMLPYFTEKFGNANSQHGVGREAAVAVDKARGQVAAAINAKPNEIYFTSGGSEADDWVLQGVCEANAAKGNEIIISSIEHSAMMTTAKWLEKHGVKVTYLNVDKGGFVDLEQLENAITDKTILVSVMLANNEIGTIEPIKDVVRIAKKHGVLVHTDAVQAVGSIPVDVKDLGVDFLSMSAHKFYGPKGVGALYIKNGVKIGKLMHGGEQERSMRAGTTNLASVVGMGEAIELAVKNLDENAKRITELRNYFIDGVLARIPYVRLNGDREKRLPCNANFSFEYIEGESILFSLDLAGVEASSGSACSSGSLEPSHTLLAIGVPVEIAHGSIRFSLGKDNTKEQIDYTLDVLVEVVERLRKMSPLYNVNKEN